MDFIFEGGSFMERKCVPPPMLMVVNTPLIGSFTSKGGG